MARRGRTGFSRTQDCVPSYQPYHINLHFCIYAPCAYCGNDNAIRGFESSFDQMPNDLVLLTGGTGHIGFRILTLLLENAFSVRAVVRSDKKAETLRSSLEKTGNADKLSKLSTVVVPVFADDNAFNVVVEGVNYIIHAGSPLGSEVPEDGGKF